MTDDPTLPMRKHACLYPDVDEGTACTQSSFKVKGKSFFFAGPQGGRYKAMFKLDQSRNQAEELAKAEPDKYQIGTNIWVTTRFSAEDPMPKQVWEEWLDESYALSLPKMKT
ncbi:MmcQ/YjbR family DNA-binding protein [Maritalea sp.]|uniref:MmcQ/YjbR family DNA-binding protein n=1 Tax=Maritalea sp. TaxID=2003361 RepID=UPI003EF447CE